jgi:protease PrsW
MAFNTTATLVSGPSLLWVYLGVAVPLVVGMVIFVVRQLFREGRLIRERLTDYVRVGWLTEGDPVALSRLRTRMRALWHAIFVSPYAFLGTVRMQRAATELAYLRDAMTRGLVDRIGLKRERDLLGLIRSLRGLAITQPEGRADYPSLRRRHTAGLDYAPPSYPGPAGIGGNYPAPTAWQFPSPGQVPSLPLGQTATQYSEVDPNWKPPGE